MNSAFEGKGYRLNRLLQGRKRVLAIAGTAVAYGALNYLLYSLKLPGSAEVISLRPQIIIPILAGICLGPTAGFASGLFGNILGDLLCGLGFHFWTWSIANGIIGCIPGFAYRDLNRQISTVAGFGMMLFWVIAANAAGLGFGFAGHNLLVGDTGVWSYFLPALLSNVYMAMFLLPVVLLAVRKIRLTLETRTALCVFYLLLLSTLTVVFLVGEISSGALTALVKPLISQSSFEKMAGGFTILLVRWAGVTTLIVLFTGLLTAGIFTRRVLAPVTRITEASQALSTGKFRADMLESLQRREDEIGQLAGVFTKMAGQVAEREQQLNRRIESLQIVIDKQEEKERVTEIAESDYFRQLEQQVQSLRIRKRRKRNEKDES